MFKEHLKITDGFTVQTYITLPNGTMVCKAQEFHAGDVNYEDGEGREITVNTDKEVYCPMEMKQPKQIPDEDNAVKFVCPSCGDNRLEAVLDGSHTTAIVSIFKGGDIEYGEMYSNGDMERFQCVSCGYIITKDDDSRTPDDQKIITDDYELVEWIEENCGEE